MKKIHAIMALLLSGLLITCSCSGDQSAGEAPPADTVTMTNSAKFTPDSIVISAGDVVLWKNTSDLTHTVTCDPEKAVKEKDVSLPSAAKPFNSGNLKSGESFKKKFTVPGTYHYFCIPHEMLGMKGIVVVK